MNFISLVAILVIQASQGRMDAARKDPVLAFINRVNVNAVSSPLWDRNYALASYRAFCEESRKETARFGSEGDKVWMEALDKVPLR